MTYRAVIGVPGAPGATAVDEAPEDNSIALLGATTADMNLYVDPVAGSDSSPGTAALPVKTLAAALALVPRTINNYIHLHLAAGNYAEPFCVYNFNFPKGALFIEAPMVVKAGQPTRTATIFSGTTIGTAGAGMTVNEHEDAWVLITAGTGAGQMAKVRSNTADTFTVYPAQWGAWGPNGTSQYQVVVPGARFTGVIHSPDPWLYDRGLDIVLPPSEAQKGLAVYGVEIVNGEATIYGAGSISFDCCTFRWHTHIETFVGDLLFGGYWFTVGVVDYFDNQFGCYMTNSNPGAGAYFGLTLASARWITFQNNVLRGGLDLVDSAYQFYYCLFLYLASAAGRYNCDGATGQYSYRFYGATFDGIDNLKIWGGTLGMPHTVVQNCAGGGIVLDDFAMVYADISGSGNIGTPVVLKNNSQFVSNGASTVTGSVAGAEFKCGSRPAEAWAGLSAQVSGDVEDQSFTTIVPANPGPWTIALGRALRGVLASGLVKVQDTTAGTMLTEVAPAPGATQFSVDYGTGVITFDTAEQTHHVVIYYRPVLWQNCVVRNYT